jgi:hypothetical protein
MGIVMRTIALRAACLLLVSFSFVTGTAFAANPLGLAWRTTTNVELYAKPTGMLVTGRCNTADPKFAAARAKGAEVLVYLNAVERPDNYVCAQDEKFYMGNRAKVPLWPYPTYGQRVNWGGTRMTDMRPGSAWILHVVSYIEGLMREGKVDGVFLDCVGGKLWSSTANWKSWPLYERNAWTDGSIDLVRRLDAKRRAINPFFIIVNNNVWHRLEDTRPAAGERYVDGVVLEHHLASSIWHKKYAARPFGNLGQRRVLIIARDNAEAVAWSKVPGVTHVSNQGSGKYGYPLKPVISFNYLGDREQ